MVNTRNIQCNGQPSNNNNNANLEQLLNNQNQLMQAMLQTLNNMQPNQQQVPPPPPPHQSHLVEFLRTRPSTFSQAKYPMDADDWLKGVEKKLVITQCTDHEKVLFAAHQLYGCYRQKLTGQFGLRSGPRSRWALKTITVGVVNRPLRGYFWARLGHVSL
jgi:hypothetical protein